MRGSRCLKVWTQKQLVVALSSAESELHAALEGLGIQSLARDLGISCRVNLHLDAKRIERPGDNDTGVLTPGGNSRITATVRQCGVSVGHWRQDGY